MVYLQRRLLLLAKGFFGEKNCVSNKEFCKIMTDYARKELATMLADI